MIGELGKGYKYAIEILNVGRIGIGAQVDDIHSSEVVAITIRGVCVCVCCFLPSLLRLMVGLGAHWSVNKNRDVGY